MINDSRRNAAVCFAISAELRDNPATMTWSITYRLLRSIKLVVQVLPAVFSCMQTNTLRVDDDCYTF